MTQGRRRSRPAQATTLTVRAQRTNRRSRLLTAHLPSIVHPPKGLFGPWRSRHQRMLHDAIAIQGSRNRGPLTCGFSCALARVPLRRSP
jgi:hypothetical protein